MNTTDTALMAECMTTHFEIGAWVNGNPNNLSEAEGEALCRAYDEMKAKIQARGLWASYERFFNHRAV